MNDANHLDDRRLAGLMAAAQDGDRAAYAALLRELLPILRRAARQRLRGAPSDVEDLVQETLKSLHQVRHSYDPARPLLPWVFAILRYRAADAMRRHVRTAGREVAIDPERETFAHAAANTGSEAALDGAALRRAVDRLPPSQKTAIELVKLKEMTLKEASVVSGMSVPALKVATHRAIKSLRAALRAGE
jgi:RNA polymerase sigma-70 factor (ECF subfamily)